MISRQVQNGTNTYTWFNIILVLPKINRPPDNMEEQKLIKRRNTGEKNLRGNYLLLPDLHLHLSLSDWIISPPPPPPPSPPPPAPAPPFPYLPSHIPRPLFLLTCKFNYSDTRSLGATLEPHFKLDKDDTTYSPFMFGCL